jgi:hypothetical protein
MARLTKEQKAIQEILEQEIAEKAFEEYTALLPFRILNAIAAAGAVGVSTQTTLCSDGKPETRFEYEDHKRKNYIDRAISYNSDQWEIDILEGELEELRLDKIAQEERLVLAHSVVKKLTEKELEALKEFIHVIK